MTHKAVPILFRQKRETREILAFRHPLAGIQIVKGTIEPGEEPKEAACRELSEEAGIKATSAKSLGTSDIVIGQTWHFFLMTPVNEPPSEFDHFCQDDGGHVFKFFWHDTSQPMLPPWGLAFRNAVEFALRSLK